MQPNNNYAWWVGQDGNIWANVNGNVDKYTQRGSGTNSSIVVGKDGDINGISLWGSNQIEDPNKPANNDNNNAANNNSVDTDYSAIYAAQEAAKRANQDKYYDDLISVYQNKLDNAGSALAELNAKSKEKFDTQQSELQTAYDNNKQSYDKSTTQNAQNNLLARNTITDNASRGLRSLLRTLGAMGAGGSSAALYNAPDAVTEQANTEYANAGNEYAQNQQNLDTNWNTYAANWENDKKKSKDAYDSELRANEQTVINTKNDLLSKIMEANSGRAAYGNGFVNGLMDRVVGQMKANDNRYNELNKFQKSSYDGTTAKYEAPALSTYNTNNVDLTTQVQGNTDGSTTPTLAMLLGINRRNNEE